MRRAGAEVPGPMKLRRRLTPSLNGELEGGNPSLKGSPGERAGRKVARPTAATGAALRAPSSSGELEGGTPSIKKGSPPLRCGEGAGEEVPRLPEATGGAR